MLFINRVYPPDDGATGQLLAELAQELTRAGWRVTVLAAGKGNEHRTSNTEHQTPKLATAGMPSTLGPRPSTLSIHRVRGLPFTRASLVRRALSYASLYPALLWRALRLPRHDVIVTLTDPPLLLTLGPLLKFVKRARLVHWAQDVYPEVAEELGVLRRNGFAVRLLRALSTGSLRRHDHVIAVGRCMKARLVARGIDEAKITVIPNWAVGASLTHPLNLNPNPNPPLPSASPVARDSDEPSSVQSSEFKAVSSGSQLSTLNSQLPFTVMYSGNFGLAHPFGAILEAVKLLTNENAPVRFVFAGSGPKLESVRTALASCANVEFRPPAPLEKLSESLAAADVHLACMSDALLGLVVPSKIYGALAAGRPCLFLGPRESEAARIILESRRGLVFDPQTGGAELAAVLRRWAARDAEFSALRTACAIPPPGGVPLPAFIRALSLPTASH